MTDKMTILIVDDAPENLGVLSGLLQPDYQVRVANSGPRALAVAGTAPLPDLILLDIMMPGMDGYAVLERLKAAPVTRDIPVIFITALTGGDDEYRGLALGAVDYITKPLAPAIVLARLRTQLELKRARDRLHRENLRLEAEVARRSHQRELILLSAAEGICGTGPDGRITFINPAGAALLGYDRADLVGRDVGEVLCSVSPAASTPGADGIDQSDQDPDRTASGRDTGDAPGDTASDLGGDAGGDAGGNPGGDPGYAGLPGADVASGHALARGEDCFRHKDGSLVALEWTCQPMVEAGQRIGAVITFRDIGERRRYLAELEHRSNFDTLTGLPNRNLLTDRIAQGIARSAANGTPLAVLRLNLDRFKAINESLGHGAGDLVLKEAARRLQAALPGDVTLARNEGDEFVVVAAVAAEALSRLGRQLLEALAATWRFADREFLLTGSLGVALYPRDGGDSEALLHNAGAALTQAKLAGGNLLKFYAAQMNARALDRLELENGLRRAIEQDQLVLHFQPQMSLRTGAIIGVEALVRWQHPERGLVPPNAFIPVAEQSDLILALGEWVLRAACAQNRAWQLAGLPPIAVAVNLSARQFTSQDIAGLTARLLAETGLAGRWLELELTESILMADTEAFVRATRGLKGLDISLSIDDFGTGFSSLAYLRRFSIDRLKIDQSFIRELCDDTSSAAIARAIISLSHSLGIAVIAEGVETRAQLAFLQAHYCDEVQGYLFSRPLPADELAALLREGPRLALPTAAELALFHGATLPERRGGRADRRREHRPAGAAEAPPAAR